MLLILLLLLGINLIVLLIFRDRFRQENERLLSRLQKLEETVRRLQEMGPVSAQPTQPPSKSYQVTGKFPSEEHPVTTPPTHGAGLIHALPRARFPGGYAQFVGYLQNACFHYPRPLSGGHGMALFEIFRGNPEVALGKGMDRCGTAGLDGSYYTQRLK